MDFTMDTRKYRINDTNELLNPYHGRYRRWFLNEVLKNDSKAFMI
jgi:hypothetical protein